MMVLQTAQHRHSSNTTTSTSSSTPSNSGSPVTSTVNSNSIKNNTNPANTSLVAATANSNNDRLTMNNNRRPVLRRKRSKGTIADFASSSSNKQNSNNDAPGSFLQPQQHDQHSRLPGGGPAPEVTSALYRNNRNAVSAQAPSAADHHSLVDHEHHFAWMALLCCQQAVQMRGRIAVRLCPPGRLRRTLQSELLTYSTSAPTRGGMQSRQQRPGSGSSSSGNSSSSALTVPGASAAAAAYYSLEDMVGGAQVLLEQYPHLEEETLSTVDTGHHHDHDSATSADEAAYYSSGDEDDLRDVQDLFSKDPMADLDSMTMSAAAIGTGSSHSIGGAGGSGSATSSLLLREPLFTPGMESNPNSAPQQSQQSGAAATGFAGDMNATGGGVNGPQDGNRPFGRRKLAWFDTVSVSDRSIARSYLRKELQKVRRRQCDAVLANVQLPMTLRGDKEESMNSVSRLPALPVTPSLAAALILESLQANPVESLEGMAKCYDGIVAAGMAVLDESASRSEILTALAPLLITSLELPSGETILQLARLRRMCGTIRYQRRFVQRIAPSLIRPPRSALWCLRHQNDMTAILAATELILDAAWDVFGKGWYERGQVLRADSKRAETLSQAAMQLRNLSGSSEHQPAFGSGGAASPGDLHHAGSSLARRRLMARKDVAGEPLLAEWEVMAVDRQIRVSISSLMSTDWSRTHLLHSDVPRPLRRAPASSGTRRVQSGLVQPNSAITTSPVRTMHAAPMAAPLSPPHMVTAPSLLSSPGPDTSEDAAFSFPERPSTPPPPPSQMSAGAMMSPLSPPRHGPDASSAELTPTRGLQQQPQPPPPVMSTPPRSPKSPHRGQQPEPESAAILQPPLSPKRSRTPGSVSNHSAASSQGSVLTPGQHSSVGSAPTAASGSMPLSPSSVGTSTTAGSGAEMVSFRPSSVAMPSSLSSQGAGSTNPQYRVLTSTAAERKRTVAACRALRAQISRFEDAFVQLHGRPPKGAAERAPLATTYAQYREWKRAIRADAACRIQALYRGARTRWMLLRRNDQRLARVVMTRAGRASFGEESHRRTQETVIQQLSIPVEIGQADQHLDDRPSSMTAQANAYAQGGDRQQPLAPQWASKIVRRRSNSGDRAASEEEFGPNVPTPQTFKSPSPSPTYSHPSSPSELSDLSLAELQARKRELKQQLKQYDMNFARKHGRLPVKAEKEPIRHLYEAYNALKSSINLAEQEGRHIQPSPVQSPAHSPVPQHRNVSPTLGLDAGFPNDEASSAKASSNSSGSSPLPSARGKRKVLKSTGGAAASGTAAPPMSSSTTAAGAPLTDLAALKAEKGQLHQMLRSYEKDFFKEHKRQVSSFADIKPVASQYRRYKEIKKAIAALQQTGNEK